MPNLLKIVGVKVFTANNSFKYYLSESTKIKKFPDAEEVAEIDDRGEFIHILGKECSEQELIVFSKAMANCYSFELKDI